MKLEIGVTVSRTKKITSEDIRLFAQVSGDTNPVHLDDEYAAKSQFGKRIAHGILTGSLISTILGNDLPGRGTIYLSQLYKFKAPVFVDEEITATVELVKYRENRRIATFNTFCTNQDGVVVLEGEAVVLAPKMAEEK
jgi:3-hydroxybutyryl-CoA dehydratase